MRLFAILSAMSPSRHGFLMFTASLFLGLACVVNSVCFSSRAGKSKPLIGHDSPLQTAVNDICAEKNKPNFVLNLTAVMIFPKHVLLIDRNFLVFQMPLENVDSYGSMLFNITGVPIEEKWPGFKGNAHWEQEKLKHKDWYHLFDEHNQPWIFIDILRNQGQGHGVHVNLAFKADSGTELEVGKVTEPQDSEQTQNRERIVQDDKGKRIYALYEQDDKPGYPPLLLARKFTHKKGGRWQSAQTTGFPLYYLVDKGNSSRRNITIFRQLRREVYSEENNPLVGSPGYENYRLENVTKDWHIANGHMPMGFIHKGFVHLFDYDKIIIFADAMLSYEEIDNFTMFNKSHKIGSLLMNVKVDVISVKDYFRCEGDVSGNGNEQATYPPTEGPLDIFLNTNGRPLLFYILIAVGILFVLLAIALTVYCCGSSSSDKTAKPHQKPHGDHKKEKEKASIASLQLSSSKKCVSIDSDAVSSKKVSSVVPKENASNSAFPSFPKDPRYSAQTQSFAPSIKTDASAMPSKVYAVSNKLTATSKQSVKK